MGEQRARRVRPRRPPVTRTSYMLLPAPDAGRARSRERTRSPRHLELAARLSDEVGRDAKAAWATRALHACLSHLLTSTVTEAARVWVLDAWAEPSDDAVCVIYRPPHDEDRVVGLRRCRRDAVEVSDWRIGDLTTWGYDLVDPAGDGAAGAVDATRFGWNVADFDLGEPLGYVTTVLRYDTADIGWWGHLGPQLPVPPGAETPSERNESDDSGG